MFLIPQLASQAYHPFVGYLMLAAVSAAGKMTQLVLMIQPQLMHFLLFALELQVFDPELLMTHWCLLKGCLRKAALEFISACLDM